MCSYYMVERTNFVLFFLICVWDLLYNLKISHHLLLRHHRPPGLIDAVNVIHEMAEKHGTIMGTTEIVGMKESEETVVVTLVLEIGWEAADVVGVLECMLFCPFLSVQMQVCGIVLLALYTCY